MDLQYVIKNRRNLSGADLRCINLSDADLSCADLRGADLSGSGLRGTDLRGADLRGADLRGADLSGADLRGADLSDADLSGTILNCCVGNKEEVKSLQIEAYLISYTKENLNIGCETHAIGDWWDFTDREILAMDGKRALIFWRKYKQVLKQLIELNQ